LDRTERLALLSRDDEAAGPYAARIPEQQLSESWQLIEPNGVRMMHSPAAIRVLQYIPATRWLARLLKGLRLTPLATAVNRLLCRVRKPLGRFFPNPQWPHRWP
jgi:predicted DCC family thiol-disulfide oxidoreductase YuxK